MSYTLLSETQPIARKDHRCIWCGQKIEKGTKYVSERSVFDGDMQNHHWHEECLAYCREVNDDCEYEFAPYSEERPRAGVEKGERE